MTDEEIIVELRSGSPLNKARQQFSSWTARIEQRSQQRQPYSPVEMRRMEFQAVPSIPGFSRQAERLLSPPLRARRSNP